MSDSCPLVPCASCPWRVGADPADIPRFDIAKARRLPETTFGPGDAIRPIMACHGSEDGAESPCRGYLVVVGWTNIAVRLAVIGGRIPLNAILDASAGLDLYPSFAEMHANLEAKVADA